MGLSRTAAVAGATIASVMTGAGVLWWRLAGRAEAPGMAQYVAVAVGASLLGGFVVWHRPGNRYGGLHLAVGLLFGSVVLAAAVLSSASGIPVWAGHVALAWSWLVLPVLLVLWVMVIATFPDGTFHRKLLGPATLAIGLVMALLVTAAYLIFPAGNSLPLVALHPPPELSGPLTWAAPESGFRALSMAGAALGTAAPVLALVALADRYRSSGLVVRQQIKWLIAGATVSVLLQAIPAAAIESETLRTAAGVVVVLAVLLPFLAAAVAVFKHGLWEIDVVISHGLVYTILSAVLTSVFLALAVAAGVTLGGTDGRVVAAVGLALLISLLAQPLRQRLVSMVGRTLFGEGPRGLIALAAQPDRLGSSDASGLAARIAQVTRAALGAPWVQVWSYLPRDGAAGGVFRPTAGPSNQPGPAVVMVPEASSAALVETSRALHVRDLRPEVGDIVAPMVQGDADLLAGVVVDGELLGIIVCGARSGDPYGDDEQTLLAVLARDAGLGLRNIHLEEMLRRQLAHIESQAEQLRRSRQRLVSAQDQERRRIERDLHDGAQQQLVVLAAALRRAARTGASAELTTLADQAEEAVFSLQELARGIYPSVLVDHGLHAALQTQAARLPVAVRIEVAPGLRGQRLPGDLEAVLYYVGLEAMTNAFKHVPNAQITVVLRADDQARIVVLEVHDDGPGFDPSSAPGSGLQNMADRVEAASGRLSVESALGAGTWVRAEVPVPASVTALRDGARSP